MPVYTIETPSGKRLKIDAPDEATAMQGAEEWDLQNAQSPPPMTWQETAQDVGDAFGNTLTRNVTAIPGMPGTIRDLGNAATDKLFPNAGANFEKYGGTSLFSGLPTIAQTTPDKLNYEPKSPLGRGTEAVTEFAGNALLPGGLIKKGVMVAGPAMATETAGRVAHQFAPEWEPQIRAGTAIVSSILSSMGVKSVKELSTAELKMVKDRAYAQAKANGEMVEPGVFDEILSRVGTAAYEEGARPGLTKKSIKSLKYADEYSGKPIAVSELDKVRQLLKSAGGSPNLTERGVSRAMVAEFDKGLNENAINAHADARKANAAYKSSEFVDDLQHDIALKASKFSLSGKENATRDVYRQLAKNKNKTRYFDQPTREAIDRVAMGGPVENAARLGGKFAPTGPIPATAAIVGGGGDPYVTAGLMAPGMVSRLLATGLTSKNRRLAEALIKHGGEEGLRLFKQAKDERSRELLARAVLGGEQALTTTPNRE
jgi:hypothetical protein